MEQLMTGYEWGVFLNERILNMGAYTSKDGESQADYISVIEDLYFTKEISLDEYRNNTTYCNIKINSLPRKTDKYLEYIMYGFVPYQLGGIHKGIQFGHAKDTLADVLTGADLEKYLKWRKVDKTYIIKNGGTTNDTPNKDYGTMQKCRDVLKQRGVPHAEFREPDLANALTGLAFLVDERVWKTDIYPDFVPTPTPTDFELILKVSIQNEKNYAAWVEKMGGETNVFLRTWLKGFKLA